MILRIGTAALLVCLYSLGLAAQDTAASSRKNQEAYKSAQVVTHLDRTIYYVQDDIALEAGLENIGHEPIYIYADLGWGPSAGLTLEIRDAGGQLVEPSVFDDRMIAPPAPDDQYLFLRLKPNKMFVTKRVLRVRDFMPSPGKYTLRVSYSSPFPRSFADKYFKNLTNLSALFSGDPPIWSEPITLEVKSYSRDKDK